MRLTRLVEKNTQPVKKKKKKSGRYIEEIIEDHSNVIDLDVRNISTVYYKK